MPFTIDSAYTLAEVLKSYDEKGRLHDIIDVFSDKRPILEEAFWTEASAETSHEMLRMVSKPTGSFLSINEGYPKEGVATIPIKEQLAWIGSRFEIAKKLIDLQRDGAGWRAQRTRLHIRGMLENFNRKFWVGNATTYPKEVNGLLTRFNLTTSDSVTDCASWDGDTPSGTYYYPVVVVHWGLDGVMLLHPKGGTGTFTELDEGMVSLLDGSSNPYPGYRSYFDFNYGIGVADDRSVQRLVNMDVREVQDHNYFENSLADAVSKMGPLTDNSAIYVGRQVYSAIWKRRNEKSNCNFTPGNVWGRDMLTFQGLPIIQDDALSTAETTVS
jgi:hypothetical protein